MGRLFCLGRFTLLLLVALESAVDALDASSRRLGADVSTDMQDCASVACPLLFKEAAPAINLGAATYSSTQKRGGSRKLRAPPATMLELTRKLYGPEAQIGEPYLRYSNPYNKVRDESYKWTQVNEHVLESAFEVVGHPVRFIVEVGSFTGGSATQIGTFVRNRNLQTPVLAMDTWEGDVTMALGKYKNFMDKRHGQPQLYHQFLVNMIARNLSTTVLPFMVPSLVGAKILDYLQLQADIIFLDSAHEEGETFFEISQFWSSLAPGGILMGDDFNWRAVAHDSQLFARVYNIELMSVDNCHKTLLIERKFKTCVWFLKKPG